MKKLDCGFCKRCGMELEPVYFKEKESYIDSHGQLRYTGRSRIAVDYLVCPDCLKRVIVDEGFGNGEWTKDE